MHDIYRGSFKVCQVGLEVRTFGVRPVPMERYARVKRGNGLGAQTRTCKPKHECNGIYTVILYSGFRRVALPAPARGSATHISNHDLVRRFEKEERCKICNCLAVKQAFVRKAVGPHLAYINMKWRNLLIWIRDVKNTSQICCWPPF